MFLASQAAVQPMLAAGKGCDHQYLLHLRPCWSGSAPLRAPGWQPFFQTGLLLRHQSGVLGFTVPGSLLAGKNIRVNALTPGGVYNGHDEVFTAHILPAHSWGVWQTSMR
jgi:hypothetical protein